MSKTLKIKEENNLPLRSARGERWKLAEQKARPASLLSVEGKVSNTLLPAQPEEPAHLPFQLSEGSWRDAIRPPPEKALAPTVDYYTPAVAVLLAQQGITGRDTQRFLAPMNYDDFSQKLPNYLKLRDLKPAIKRLADAIERKETIGISGDYDCDGNCSTALMIRMLHDCGVPEDKIKIHIPNRKTEGYGVNSKAVDDFKKNGAQLMVTLDNGTLAFEPIAHAKKLGMDVIVVDHHPNSAHSQLPEGALVINPNRTDETHANQDVKSLAAVGVSYLLCAGLKDELSRRKYFESAGIGAAREPHLENYLGLVALATIGDVVNIKGSINRFFLKEGLKVINAGKDPAISTFAQAANLNLPISDETIAFQLAPMINAPGRLGDSVGWKMLSTQNLSETHDLAVLSKEANEERKRLEAEITKDARRKAQGILDKKSDTPVLVLAGNNWNEGIIGIVAGRIKEEFGRPCAVCALAGDHYKCSARSIKGVDLGEAFRSLAEGKKKVLLKAGGHPMAAGATFNPDQLEAFRSGLNDKLGEDVQKARDNRTTEINGVLRVKNVTPALVQAIETLDPFGEGHKKPAILMRDVLVRQAKLSADGRHFFCSLVDQKGISGSSSSFPPEIKAMAFHVGGTQVQDVLLKGQNTPIHVTGTLVLDNEGLPVFRIEDTMLAKPNEKPLPSELEITRSGKDAFAHLTTNKATEI